MNVPCCVFSIFITLIFCKSGTNKKHNETLDFLASSLFITALICFMFGLSSFNNNQFTVPLVSLMLSLLLFLLFYQKNKKSTSPLFDVNLLKISAFNVCLLIRFLFMLTWVALLFSLPLFLQNILLFTPLQAGFIMLAMTVLLAITSPIAGRWSDKVGVKKPITIGIICCLLSLLLLAIPSIRQNLLLLLLSLLPLGLSAGIIMPITIIGTISSIPIERKGTALGLLFTLSFAGGSIGTSIVSFIYTYLSWHRLQSLLVTQNIDIPLNIIQDTLKNVVSGASSISQLTPQLGLSDMQVTHLIPLVQRSFGFGFTVSLLIFAILMASLLSLVRLLQSNS